MCKEVFYVGNPYKTHIFIKYIDRDNEIIIHDVINNLYRARYTKNTKIPHFILKMINNIHTFINNPKKNLLKRFPLPF